MKRLIIMLFLLIIILLLAILGKENYNKFKKKILHIENYVKVYYSYMGKNEETQEVSGIYFEKKEFNDGYLILNSEEVISLTNGTVVYKGIMNQQKTILVMNDNCTYKYQNIDEYKCYLFQSIKSGDVIASNNGATYYEVQNEN